MSSLGSCRAIGNGLFIKTNMLGVCCLWIGVVVCVEAICLCVSWFEGEEGFLDLFLSALSLSRVCGDQLRYSSFFRMGCRDQQGGGGLVCDGLVGGFGLPLCSHGFLGRSLLSHVLVDCAARACYTGEAGETVLNISAKSGQRLAMSFTWDQTDFQGRQVQPGAYVLQGRLESGWKRAHYNIFITQP